MSIPWMPLYVGDYLKNTRHLSAAEHGAYLLLIMSYWEDKGLPADERQIMRLTAMTEKEWKASRDTIAAFFEPGWRHTRIEAEIAEAEAKHNRRAQAGRKGGLSKPGISNASVTEDEKPKQNGSNASSNASSPAQATYAGDAGGNSQPQPPSPVEDNPKPQQPTTSGAPAAAEKPVSVSEAVAQAMARRGQPSPLHDLARLCHEAMGFRGKVPSQFEVVGPIEDLIEAGWSLERHILPVLRSTANRSKRGSTWGYYIKIITNGASEPPKPPAPPPAAPVVDHSPERLHRLARIYVGTSRWPEAEMTEPGKPGSPITAEILDEARRIAAEERARMIAPEEAA